MTPETMEYMCLHSIEIQVVKVTAQRGSEGRCAALSRSVPSTAGLADLDFDMLLEVVENALPTLLLLLC